AASRCVSPYRRCFRPPRPTLVPFTTLFRSRHAPAQRLPGGLLHAGGHARPARHVWRDLDHRDAGAAAAARPAPRESPAPAVPEHVLAFSRRDLDRRVHVRLPAGGAVMSAGRHEPQATAHDQFHDAGHYTLRGYLVGFGVAALLTAAAFWIVMSGVIPRPGVASAVVVALAIAQILVQTGAFLHVN